MIGKHTLYMVFFREKREKVKEMQCFLVDRKNYLRLTMPFCGQKQKGSHSIQFQTCNGGIGLAPFPSCKVVLFALYELLDYSQRLSKMSAKKTKGSIRGAIPMLGRGYVSDSLGRFGNRIFISDSLLKFLNKVSIKVAK